jgi:hypothetical protein
VDNDDGARGAHPEDVLETVFPDERWLRDGVKLVEVEERVDGSGDEGDADVRPRERRRETLRVILPKRERCEIYDEAGGCSASKEEDW